MKTRTAWLRHPSEDALEDYARLRLGEAESASLEAHLLACESCQAALQNIDDFILAIRENGGALRRRAGAVETSRPPWVGLWQMSPWEWLAGWVVLTPGRTALAGATALLCIVVVTHRPPASLQSPASVTLTAFRGGDPAYTATAPAGRTLALEIDAPDLSGSTQYRVEVVNATGRTVWSGMALAAGGQLNLSVPEAFRAGIYWVRVYTSGSEPMREFGLRLE